jgi:DNA repair protein RadA/Sms
MNGLRPLLIEIQALVSESPFAGNPRRIAIGFDNYRLSMLISIIEKKLKLPFYKSDVFLNVTGGMIIREPAVDLAVCSALISSYKNISANPNAVVMGEVGLTGEIRPISFLETRLKEAIRQGFTSFSLPAAQNQLANTNDLSVFYVENIFDFYNNLKK